MEGIGKKDRTWPSWGQEKTCILQKSWNWDKSG